MEIKELDTVVLERDQPTHGLKRGDIGAVVHIYNKGEAVEVEFVSVQGETVALLTLNLEDISPMRGHAILHMRELAA